MSLWLNPERVTLLGVELDGVASISVDRRSARTILEWTDNGPHPAFGDVGEVRADITIVRERRGVEVGFLSIVEPGAQGPLTFRASANSSDALVVDVTASVMVTGVEHTMSQKHGARQTIRCVGLSADGDQDPVLEMEVE